MTFGEEIKELRKKADLSLRDLSERTGISRGYLSKMENDKIGIPKHENIRKLADGLGISFTQLLEKSGQITQTEWNSAFAQEGFNVNDAEVMERALINKQSPHVDIKELLENINSLSYNGHDLMDTDRKQILDMLAVLFPIYSKEKRNR